MSADPKVTACPGAGRRWRPGMGSQICPVCHRGSRGLGVTGRLPKVVPAHTIR